eukprot:CAMPEP_0197311112 /NCGR_PEP_ID=MMETSP0891-20130614/9629_1 /TAXON_ID=44058 ORGANISM="Aureoumbra lagunensis, Strain CCMP1510" /NCGR_SAMPLE_ID=MMETSP0891 /ASSEMBLY_ACC=CAM_ASM_000534 /LENGTH=1392 /DNA_ID=CAMNT_0042797071 /DNA_START=168 /DNA_END=4346 /DNA_ORIENTATION=-
MNHHSRWSTTDVGGLCWVSDPAQAYMEASLTAVGEGRATAKTTDGREFDIDLKAPLLPPSRKQKEPPRRLLQRVPLTTNNGVENMDNLAVLHEASILDNIQRRFRMDLIYTNTGPILIAMNPFKWLPIYGDDVISRFHGRPYGSMPPHVYQEAEDSFVQLQKYRKNQAIVICGESGAGKTESTKLMLHYLAVVSKRTSEREAKRRSVGSDIDGHHGNQPTIAERIVNSNPLLESYGNAKTLRNDNSSRFGKFTRFDFGMGSAVINGGHIENLLLEKVRVVEQGQGERNYHVFYQLVEAAKQNMLDSITGITGSMANCDKHTYTNGSGCIMVDSIDDREEYNAMVGALDAISVKPEDRKLIFNITCAVYWLGDIDFEPTTNDATKLASSTQGAMDYVAKLLQLDKKKLSDALCVRVREVPGGEKVVSNNNPKEARHLRDALAKSIYSRLFDWLVHRCNQTFDVSSAPENQYIGILDIFGFEDMMENTFEQVFINTTNEQLQKVFNDIIFKAEAEEYSREQIEWDKTAFPDNTPCIELLTKRPHGLLRILDAECLRGMSASDGANLAAKFNRAHGNNNFYEICGPASVWRRNNGERTREEDFLIRHFAGPIVYTISMFVDKNRDALFGHVHDIVSMSNCPIVSDIFPKRGVDEAAEQASKQTVANKYLGQLNTLVNDLRQSSTRFVRCIKTNNEKLPAKLDKPLVLRQLICSGVMAALEVRRAGFPTRIPFRDFVREFRAFTPRGGRHYTDDKELAAKMMQHPHVAQKVKSSTYRLGVSKLFLQAEILYELESIKNNMLYPFVRRLQRWWVKLQGSILQRKFKRCSADLSEAMTEASIKAVSAVAYVIESIAVGERAKEKASVAVSSSATPVAVEAIVEFRKAVDHVKKIVAAAVAQKEEAYRIRAVLLSEIDSGNERCSALIEVANSLYDPKDVEILRTHAKDAEKALAACRTELMTVATQWETATLRLSSEQGPHTLRRAGTKASLDNQRSSRELDASAMTPEEANAARRKRLDHAMTLVREAETKSQVMLERKRAMDEARAEFQGSLDLASERLSAIQVDVFIISGIKTVSNAVALAREAIFAAQKALQAIDPEPVKMAVEEATQAVENALATAQHEAARVAAMVTLDESEKTLVEIEYSAQEQGFSESLKNVILIAQEAIATARQACSYPDVHVLTNSTQRAVDAVNGCGELLERETARKRAAEKAKFDKLLGIWDARASSSSVPRFARKDGAQPKPLFRVPRVKVVNEDVSGVGSSSDVAANPPSPPQGTSPEATTFTSPTIVPIKAPHPTNTQLSPTGMKKTVMETPVVSTSADIGNKADGKGLDTWIDANSFSKYSTQIKNLVDDLDDLREIEDADADEVIKECGMAKIPARRFKKALIELGARISK